MTDSLTYQSKSPAKWVPTLYFMEALPYVMVNVVSVVLLTDMGLSDTQQAIYTSMMYLPWVIKPLWSPIVDSIATKRKWILATQFLCALGLLIIAFFLPTDYWLLTTVGMLWIVAFSSASHDIAADGFYIISLDSHRQAKYVGIRSTFYRIGMIFGQGLIVIVAGWICNGAPLGWGDSSTYLLPNAEKPLAWAITFGFSAIIAIILLIYHKFVLPKNEYVGFSDNSLNEKHSFYSILTNTLVEFKHTLKVFFSKKQIWVALLFMLLFRFPEAQLVKIAQPFMLNSSEIGGLGLAKETVGFAYGTLGVIGLLVGGIIGGFVVAKDGLKKWLWPMVLAISVPDAVYIYLSFTQTSDVFAINSCVFVEQLGYGFGFTAYMMYLIYFARGENSTSVYALCTAFMALGMMIPGLFAGWLSDTLGYKFFFIWILISTVITFLVTAFLKIDPTFGKKEDKMEPN